MNQKYEVFLQPFSDEYTNKYDCVELICSRCKEKVQSKTRVQADLSVGGVGHKCQNCGAYLAIFSCPSCNKILIIDDEEWEILATDAGSTCPECKAFLYRKKWETGAIMGSSGIILPGIKNWSSTEIEKLYLKRCNKRLTSNNKELFSVLHYTVGIRVETARNSMEYLLGNKWYSPLVLSNTPYTPKDSNEYKTPFSHDFHSNLFSFINNLRSALDIVSQEICFHIAPTVPEELIELFCLNKFIPDEQDNIKEIVTQFINNRDIIYLNKLRNLLQHRRIPLMVSTGSYNSDLLDSIKPKTARSLALIELPADLDHINTSQLNNNYCVPVFQKISCMYSVVEQFILKIYNNINT